LFLLKYFDSKVPIKTREKGRRMKTSFQTEFSIKEPTHGKVQAVAVK